MTLRSSALLVAAILACSAGASAAPTVVETTVLGPFTGHPAGLHPDNVKPNLLAYYGTDLGWSYQHGGRIHFLFGDTHASGRGEGITPLHDDGFGTLDLAEWPDGRRISPTNLPSIRMGQVSGSSQMLAIDPGFPLEGLKTPIGGFSNGTQEFGAFITGKPKACRADSDCSNGLACDAGLGFVGSRPDQAPGLTFGCLDAAAGCAADTMVDAAGKPIAGSGLCVDTTSSLWANTDFGRVGAVGMIQWVGARSATEPQKYGDLVPWLSNKFINTAMRAVGTGANQRVLLWGRPWFVGVNAKERTLAMYFAYADMPSGPVLKWTVHYFTGTDAKGVPQYSANEKEAAAVDLDSTRAGVQPQERYDIVQHMSVVWIGHLKKWVMFYGGGLSRFPIPSLAPNCGLTEIFARAECRNVVAGNGAIRMRTADEPWGPWSPAQDVIIGGDPDELPVKDQFAPNGVLHHPACTQEGCTPASPSMQKGDYGWLYGVNIIEPWITPVGKAVDVFWNASTWDPYRVVLLRTRINP